MKKTQEEKNNSKKGCHEESTPTREKRSVLNALLIEDNPLIQQIHSKYLQKLHYLVKIASTQQQALEYAFYQRYDLIITDLGLCDNRSEAIITNLRQAPSVNPKTPLIVVTAYSGPALKSRCLRAGANEFIVKPLSYALLEVTLKKLIDPRFCL